MGSIRAEAAPHHPTSDSNPNPTDAQPTRLRPTRFSRSPLDQLPIDDQWQLFQLLNDFGPLAVAEKYFRSIPGAAGMKTSESALQRFHRRFAFRRQREIQSESIELVRDVLNDPAATDSSLAQAADRVFHRIVLEEIVNPGLRLERFEKYAIIHNRLRRLDLLERKIALLEKRHPSTTPQSPSTQSNPSSPSSPSSPSPLNTRPRSSDIS